MQGRRKVLNIGVVNFVLQHMGVGSFQNLANTFDRLDQYIVLEFVLVRTCMHVSALLHLIFI